MFELNTEYCKALSRDRRREAITYIHNQSMLREATGAKAEDRPRRSLTVLRWLRHRLPVSVDLRPDAFQNRRDSQPAESL